LRREIADGKTWLTVFDSSVAVELSLTPTVIAVRKLVRSS
jgi:hypothetical protein